ncbi:hypothetical protein D3C85_1046510 [compost metagenome]
MRVVDAVLEWRPALAAVLGAQDQVEHTDHIAHLVVGEPDVEQRLVRALADQPLAFFDAQRPLFVGGLGTGQRAVILDLQVADLAAIELLAPGGAGIAAVQHHTVAAHGPALLRRREGHRVKIGADRHAGLQPALAIIVGIKNVAPLSDCDQSLSSAGGRQQGTAHGQDTGFGRLIEHINEAGGLAGSLHQRQGGAQRQQHALLVRTHTASSRGNCAGRALRGDPTSVSGAPHVRRGRASACHGILNGCQRLPGTRATTVPWTATRCSGYRRMGQPHR